MLLSIESGERDREGGRGRVGEESQHLDVEPCVDYEAALWASKDSRSFSAGKMRSPIQQQ